MDVITYNSVTKIYRRSHLGRTKISLGLSSLTLGIKQGEVFYSKLAKMPRPGREKAIADILYKVGLSESCDRPISGYSKGMMQRVSMAQALVHNPEYWPFQKFVTGIGYKQTNQFEKMVEMLEDSVRHAECPTMVKAILANAYKRHKRYSEAIVLWESILVDKNGREYHAKAQQEIPRLQKLLGESR